jgi:uncharacterized protein
MSPVVLLPIALVLTVAMQAPVSPPVAQRSAECAAPVYATDTLVCGDPDLRREDEALRSTSKRTAWACLMTRPCSNRPRSSFDDAAVRISDGQRACVAAAFRERTAVTGRRWRPAIVRCP